MTYCTKSIWIVVFSNEQSVVSERTERVLASSLKEVLSFYNEIGTSSITKIEKTNEKATYHY